MKGLLKPIVHHRYTIISIVLRGLRKASRVLFCLPEGKLRAAASLNTIPRSPDTLSINSQPRLLWCVACGVVCGMWRGGVACGVVCVADVAWCVACGMMGWHVAWCVACGVMCGMWRGVWQMWRVWWIFFFIIHIFLFLFVILCIIVRITLKSCNMIGVACGVMGWHVAWFLRSLYDTAHIL